MAQRCLIIAEIAQAHDGSLGAAHAYIDAAAQAGADAVKFQMHIAAEESTPSEPWRVKFSRQDASRYDYWRRMEFSESQWAELKAHCDQAGVEFLCSPFSLLAVERLKRIGMPAWKIASGEALVDTLFDAMAETGWPIYLSTGMSAWSEIDQMVNKIQTRGLDLTLFQCTSQYPTPAERVGLNVLQEFRHRYSCEVGLSDHSGKVFAGIAAATLGASAIEVHIAWHRQSFGPDVPASLTLEELHLLVNGVREVETMLNHPVDKDAMAQDLSELRGLFSKSVALVEAAAAGTRLEPHHLAAKKPGTGVPATRLHEFVGKTLRQDLAADTLLLEEHVA